MSTQELPHNWFLEQIAAYLTGGLSQEEYGRFNAHVDECETCSAALAAAQSSDAALLALCAAPSKDFEEHLIAQLRQVKPRRVQWLRRPIRLNPMVLRAASGVAAAIVLGAVGYQGSTMIKNQPKLLALSNPFTINQTLMNKFSDGAAASPALVDQSRMYYSGSGQSELRKQLKSVNPIQLGMADKKADAALPSPQDDKDSQNVLYGASHARFQESADGNRRAYVQLGVSGLGGGGGGGNRDQLNASDHNFADQKEQYLNFAMNSNSSYDRQSGTGSLAQAHAEQSAPHGLTVANGGALVLNSVNSYAGGTQISSGTLRLGNDRQIQNAMGTSEMPQATVAAPANLYFSLDNLSRADATADKRRVLAAAPGDASMAAAAPSPVAAPAAPTDVPVQNIPAQAAGVPVANPAPAPVDTGRQIIRHGDVSFEVDSFDSAALQVRKIAAEESGFIASSSSEKLANGKVAGVISVRVPPDHLDSLVMKLRGLGDLKGQKIVSDDITKQYTDLQSQLRAAKAMEERLLEIIKTANAQVKDLLAAEKELGVWREKDETLTGEINYYNNLVSLSTLEINIAERDIRQAALATETETVNMGVETEDVEKARTEALKAIDQAKGRIIQSDLKKFDAGQLAATITASVSPDASGLVVDRLKQLGRVARLDISRKQSAPGNATVPSGIKVDRQDTQLIISLYNLANVAPRETTNLALASEDVEKSYHAIIARVADAGGRIVDSSLNRAKPDQISAAINFEAPADKADAVLADVRAQGEVMHLTVAENPDAANVTASKRGFSMTLVSLATVAPRETITSTVMPAGDLANAYHSVLEGVHATGANVTTAQLTEQNSRSALATLVFDVARVHLDEIQQTISKALGSEGSVLVRQSARSTDTENTIDSKVQLNLTFISADTLGPRESIGRVLAVADVASAYEKILAAAQQASAKITGAKLDQSNPQQIHGELDMVIPKAGIDAVEKVIVDTKAAVISRAVNRSSDVNSTTEEKTEFRLVIDDLDQLPPRQTTTMGIEVADPEKDCGDIQAAAIAAGGRVLDQNIAKSDRYVAHVVIDVPIKSAGEFINRARAMGDVKNIEQNKNNDVPDADFVHARIDLTLTGQSQIVDSDTGLWTSFKAGLHTSITGLLYSLEMIVIGLCLLTPWAAVLWVGWKFLRRGRAKRVAAV
ncbi:MAG: DUF4349 domain-containing protein [Planctomycetota bacterium]|nr:DUF4349 domain-containing protein [Planctomycetota bacterium]